MVKQQSIRTAALAVLTLIGATAFQCEGGGFLAILTPRPAQLSLPGDVAARALLGLPGFLILDFEAELDGGDVTGQFTLDGPVADGILPGLTVGPHELVIHAETWLGTFSASRSFEVIAYSANAACDNLNEVECLLPYPSDQFRGDKVGGGHQLNIPEGALPQQGDDTIPVDSFEVRDGFSPTAQVLMHFPAGVDVEASGLARLQESLQRSTDLTSLAPDSPSVLVEAADQWWQPGTRIFHWNENDARFAGPERRVLFLRPGQSLTPDKRYIVAMRNLVDDQGAAVEPEFLFRVYRDRIPTTIPSIEARRDGMERIFRELNTLGIDRDELVLAFDFTVASDHNLTGQMLSMRDQAFDWLALQDPASLVTIDEEASEEFDCSVDGQTVWKKMTGTYSVPLFLSSDPEIVDNEERDTRGLAPSFLMVDPVDEFTPVFTSTTQAEFGIGIPCAAQAAPLPAVVIGHGLFGNGAEFSADVAEFLGSTDADFGIAGPEAITGGTHWRGMSDPDFDDPTQGQSFIVNSIAFNLKDFGALPDRLRQGMLNQLVLARMMKQGHFNHYAAFQAPVEMGGHGVFLPDSDTGYFGISLGGVMGLMFAALTPDVERLNTDVPGMNFSLLLQRATPFILFQFALDLSLGTDPMNQIVGLQVLHELWVAGEPAGYATHITENPLPGSSAKQILMTQSWLDQQVSNQATEIAARTLKIPQLVGSLVPGLPLIPDAAGPLESAYVVYDTGSLDPSDLTRPAIIPPLANLVAEPSGCDPHARRVSIPASFEQLATFLTPGTGMVENFCDGICDADHAFVAVGPMGDFKPELPGGDGSDCPLDPILP